MAKMTGVTVSQLFDQQVAQVYTGYIPPPRKNRLFEKALIDLLDDKNTTDDKQKIRDELSLVVKTEQVYSLNNSQIYISPLQIVNITYVGNAITIFLNLTPYQTPNVAIGDPVTITGAAGSLPAFATAVNGTFAVTGFTFNSVSYTSTLAPSGTYTADTGNLTYPNLIQDYWYLRAVKAKNLERLYGVSIVTATNTTPVVIGTPIQTNLRTEQVVISGALGNTAINGTFFLKQITPLTYAVYNDQNFLSPVAGNGVYVKDSAVIDRIYYNYAKVWRSDQKISPETQPTPRVPYYEISERLIKLYPKNAEEITTDYFARPSVAMDVLNANIDYTLYFTEKFINRWIAQAAFVFTSEMNKDTQAAQALAVDKAQNP